MLYNVWTKIAKPMNNHEREAKRVADELKRTTPQPVPGRPGWTICDGKLSYDPIKDPAWAVDIKRLADEEERKKRAAAWEDLKAAVLVSDSESNWNWKPYVQAGLPSGRIPLVGTKLRVHGQHYKAGAGGPSPYTCDEQEPKNLWQEQIDEYYAGLL